jgi:hypothetical protein
MTGTMDTALETLANYRSNNTRASNEVVQKGKLVLQKKSALKSLGDERKFGHRSTAIMREN